MGIGTHMLLPALIGGLAAMAPATASAIDYDTDEYYESSFEYDDEYAIDEGFYEAGWDWGTGWADDWSALGEEDETYGVDWNAWDDDWSVWEDEGLAEGEGTWDATGYDDYDEEGFWDW